MERTLSAVGLALGFVAGACGEPAGGLPDGRGLPDAGGGGIDASGGGPDAAVAAELTFVIANPAGVRAWASYADGTVVEPEVGADGSVVVPVAPGASITVMGVANNYKLDLVTISDVAVTDLLQLGAVTGSAPFLVTTSAYTPGADGRAWAPCTVSSTLAAGGETALDVPRGCTGVGRHLVATVHDVSGKLVEWSAAADITIDEVVGGSLDMPAYQGPIDRLLQATNIPPSVVDLSATLAQQSNGLPLWAANAAPMQRDVDVAVRALGAPAAGDLEQVQVFTDEPGAPERFCTLGRRAAVGAGPAVDVGASVIVAPASKPLVSATSIAWDAGAGGQAAQVHVVAVDYTTANADSFNWAFVGDGAGTSVAIPAMPADLAATLLPMVDPTASVTSYASSDADGYHAALPGVVATIFTAWGALPGAEVATCSYYW